MLTRQGEAEKDKACKQMCTHRRTAELAGPCMSMPYGNDPDFQNELFITKMPNLPKCSHCKLKHANLYQQQGCESYPVKVLK